MPQKLICTFAFIIFGFSLPEFICAEEQPNIVFILSDDHRWDQLGCAGHPILKTPNIDELAEDGIHFKNMFVTTSICAASRATIFTGMYERGHKFTFGTKPLASKLVRNSYPKLLGDAGYRTGFVGKFGVRIEGQPQAMFDEFKPIARTPYFKKQSDGTKRHATQLIGDWAVDFLGRQAEQNEPFCLSVSFNAPHAEDGDKKNHFPVPKVVEGLYDQVSVPPAKLSTPEIIENHPDYLRNGMHRERFLWRWDKPEKYERNMRGYWGMVSGVDHVVGRIRSKLRELNLEDNTVVIFTGDNGYYLGQRGFAGKWSHYEESLRVPLIILDPRQNEKSSAVSPDEIVLNVDIAPTILDLANIDSPICQGRSLTGFIKGNKINDWRSDFLCEHLFHLPKRIPKYEGVRGKEWTYARYFEQNEPNEFLHNLNEDPDQLKNYANDSSYEAILVAQRLRCDELVKKWGEKYSRSNFPLRGDKTESPTNKEKLQPTQSDSKSQIKSKPNVLLIVSDDQKWSDYSFMGHDSIRTPSLDQLAKESAVFVRGYVPTALCRPSLATMITGLYPSQHRITGNDPTRTKAMSGIEYQNLREKVISNIDRVKTLPKYLSRAGYLSFQSGKWWEGHFSRGGFTHGMTHGDPNRGGRHGDEGLKIGRKGLRPVEKFIDEAQAKEKPFFIWYAPFLPHTPHNPPERLLAKHESKKLPKSLAKYYAMCEWFDETCGELLKIIDEKGIRDNTIVIYVTDNGWIQKTPDSKLPNGWKASFAPRSKQSPYDGGVRTPIIIRWPNKVLIGRKQTLASSIDIVPTVLAAVGIEVPSELPGINLVPITKDESLNNDRILLGEGYAHDMADIESPNKSLLYRWVIQHNLKLVKSYEGKLGRHKNAHLGRVVSDQLFDLQADPEEQQNIAIKKPEVTKRMTTLLTNNSGKHGRPGKSRFY